MRAVAPVQVHDHRGQALERAGARERARRRAPARRRPSPRARARAPSPPSSSPQTSASSSRRALVEIGGGDRVETGDDRRVRRRPGCARRASARRDRDGRPPLLNSSALATERSGVAPSAPRRASRSSSAAVGLDREDDEVDAANRVLVRGARDAARPSAAAASRARAGVARPDHDLVLARRDEPRRERAAEAAGAAEDRDPHAVDVVISGSVATGTPSASCRRQPGSPAAGGSARPGRRARRRSPAAS